MLLSKTMSHRDGATKKSLFIQVAWFDPDELKTQLEHIRQYHKDRTKDDYIYNVILDEIGTPYTLHYRNLDIIRPYLPGGDRKTFDNVFVGSSFIQYSGWGSAYRKGMADPQHRWDNLRLQRDIWTRFKSAYSTVPFHFYVNHEGVLNFFDIPNVRAGYEAYLIQSVRDGHQIIPDRAVLWSPAVWSDGPLNSGESDAIGRTFHNVERYSKEAGHYGGIRWLHLQDMMGRGRGTTQYDVRAWYRTLEAVYDWDSLRINLETFNQTPEEIQAREDWYQSQGIPVGSSWSMRHWYPTHKEL